RPREIGTPWPIHSPGFFSDPTQQAQLHLAFVSSSDYEPPSGRDVRPSWGLPAPAGGAAPAVGGAAPVSTAPPEAPVTAPASAPASAAGHYVDPLPASARIGRTDMGVDANMNPGDPTVAPGT